MVRTRFAPSPTGYLHLGGARTALFSWAYARKHGGKFILRIEDTDLERSTEEAVGTIIKSMAWLDLDYDEGPIRQSERFGRYREVIDQLIAQGRAYRCYASKEELEQLREAQMARGEKPRYDGRWRPENAHGRVPPEGVAPVIRFRNPDTGVVTWDDLVKGPISIANAELDDLVIARSDLVPTYNFAVVVDEKGRLFAGEGLENGAAAEFLPTDASAATRRFKELLRAAESSLPSPGMFGNRRRSVMFGGPVYYSGQDIYPDMSAKFSENLMSEALERTGRKSKARLQAIAGALQPVNAGVAQSVVNRILDLVRTGMLRSGDRLPSERELIDILNISRPSLREAIRALSTLGVVETRHGGGAYVTDLKARTLLAPLDFFLSLSQSNLADVFEAIAGALPDQDAIVWGDRRWTYRELDERTNRFANVLHGAA